LMAISFASPSPVFTVSAVSSTRSLGTPSPMRGVDPLVMVSTSALLSSDSVLAIVRPCAGR
jgi:hypothetical protein